MFPSPFADHILHDRTAVNINVKLSTVVNTVLRKTLKVHVHCNYVNIFHQPFPQCKISIYQCWQCHIRIYLQVSRKLQFSYFGYDIKRYDMNNFILCMKSNKNAEVQNFNVWNIFFKNFWCILQLSLWFILIIFFLHHYCSELI